LQLLEYLTGFGKCGRPVYYHLGYHQDASKNTRGEASELQQKVTEWIDYTEAKKLED